MATLDFDAIETEIDSSTEYDLAENVAEDIVHYSRGNIIANEEQSLLTHLQYGTAWFAQMERYTNSILIGPSAGGKTQIQKKAVPLLPDDLAYTATDFSDNAAIDDEEWNMALLAPLDEIDKISDPVREYLKSMAGEDGGYSKKRSVQDDSKEGGRKTVTLSSDAMPYQLLFAPENKEGGIPTELDNRLLKIFVDDNKHIREAIGRKEAGHVDIEVHGLDYQYIYPTQELRDALRVHYRRLPYENQMEGGEVVGRRGSGYATLPEWVWYSVNPIFDFATTSTNRYFGMIFNLIRSSAILNYHSREQVPMETDEGEVMAYLVEPQDVANVLSCQRTLLGTTHSLDPRKRAILQAVNDLDGLDEHGGCTLDQVKEHLQSGDQSVPSKSVLRRILKEDLAEGYYIKVREGAGPNNADLYEFRSSGSINPPRLYNLREYAARDGVTIDAERYDYDVDAPYEGCLDPIRDQPFDVTVEEFGDDLSSSAIERTKRQADAHDERTSFSAASAMGGSSGQQTLEASGDDDDDDDASVFESHVEEAVYDAVKETCGVDGSPFALDGLEDYHLGGIVDPETPIEQANLSGTHLDPRHDLWDHPSKDDDWVTTEADAKREWSEAFSTLVERGLITRHDDQPEGYVAFSVLDVE